MWWVSCYIWRGSYHDLHVHICVISGHCITLLCLVCVGYFQSWNNFSITFQNYINHLVDYAGWKLSSAAPWGNSALVTSHLLTEGICQLCSQQWYRLYHRYLWPSKWQRQLFLLTCSMSSYDRYCIIWPSFLFDCFVKIWATCENFWGNGSPPTPWQCWFDFL